MESTTRHSVINIGTGRSTSLLDVARRMASVLGVPELAAEITGQYELNDVRHCFADVRRAEEALGYRGDTNLDAGLVELVDWVARQTHTPRKALSFPAHRQLELELAS
jgi:dTDP-L-rhamnose 4-epimerase